MPSSPWSSSWQVRTVSGSPYPGIRAVEALAFTLPVYVLLFATTYFVMEHTAVSSFTESLTRTDALYFSVTTFATVGYGDIAAKSESARVVVTVQMVLDLLLLGLVVRVFLNAVKRSHQRQPHRNQQRLTLEHRANEAGAVRPVSPGGTAGGRRQSST